MYFVSDIRINCHNSLLSVLKSHEDPWGGEKGRRKPQSKTANETIKTMATMTIKELCQSATSGNVEESDGSGEEADKEPLVSTFVEAIRRFEILLLLHG